MSTIAVSRGEANGGFPMPNGVGAHLIACVHEGCGSVTAIRLPNVLPASIVRRVSCSGCAESYAARSVVDLGAEMAASAPLADAPRMRLPQVNLPRLPRRSDSGSAAPISNRERRLRIAALPLSALAVIAILFAIRGGDSASDPAGARAAESSPSAAASADATAKALQKAGKNASMVSGASYSLALPPGWKQVEPSSGASFAAIAPGGAADATLWIERDPSLSFSDFEQRSLDQLEQLAGSASVVERVSAPTEEASSVRLAADRPEGSPAYEVLLRVAGPYRYYLSTTLSPDASGKDAEALKLITGSLVPTASTKG